MVLGAVAAGSCGPPPQAPPNVLVVTLDTLRADRLSAYGFELPTTPFLAELASRGVRFERAYAASNVTKPSHASILTGLYPKHHGLITNNEAVLAEGIETLAERFRAAGYATLAVVATNLLDAERSGLAQGFDAYLDLRRRAAERGPLRLLQRRAPEVVDAFLAALGERPQEPFFAWLHFYDPHTPYRPPAAYRERFREPPRPGEAPVLLPIAPFEGTSMVKGAIPSSSALGSARDPRFYEAAYHGEIAFLDAHLERLFAALDGLGLERPLVAAITADHGEMLGEEGIYYHHVSLEEPVVRVPLLLLGSGVPEGGAIAEIVEGVDLAPTLAELAGLPEGGPLDGRSLVPLLGGRRSGDGLAFAQHSHDLAIGLRHCSGTLLLALPGQGDTVTTPFATFSRRSYLAYMGLEAPRFLPAEATAPGEPCEGADVGGLERRLAAWYRERRDYPQPGTVGISAEEAAELRALGYL